MKNKYKLILTFIIFVLVSSIIYLFYGELAKRNIFVEKNLEKVVKNDNNKNSEIKTANVVANGDILYHDILYWSVETSEGNYDFNPYFEYVKERISKADLAIGDYEGTISDKSPLAGYPLFNAPKEAAQSMKDVGYDVVDLAHNHILDTGIYGLKNTYETFKNLGLSPVGIFVEKSRSDSEILIKEVNGIKIAILAYAYGFNGLENSISKKDYDYYLVDLNEDKIKKDLATAEKQADITIVMPQMGVEYRLTPTKAQIELYHKMISWGADVILGGHPHVAEPAEIVKFNDEDKLIIYSMGNFISNQRYETMKSIGDSAKWTNRGLLMDITFQKQNNKTTIKKAYALPTMVIANKNNKTYKNGYPLYDFKVVVIEDFLKNGKYYGKYLGETYKELEIAYKEMNEHINLNWKN